MTADSGEQGLKRLEKTTPDLIILDMSMPGMGGVGFLREISSPEGKPKYPVLVLTARANMAEFFANVDVDGFVAKPCDPGGPAHGGGPHHLPAERRRSRRWRQAPRLGKKKVLLGEDDRLVNENLAAAFNDAGYSVESVFKGPEILEKAIVQKPDVIVMKLVFASMNGDAVAAMLKEMPNTKDIPVILYDDTNSKVPESKFAGPHSGVRKFVRSNNSVTLLAAMKEVGEGLRERSQACAVPNVRISKTRSSTAAPRDNGAVIRRRRMCLSCGHRFTTYEEVVRAKLRVIKRDGRHEDLDRNKLVNGIQRACEKRPDRHRRDREHRGRHHRRTGDRVRARRAEPRDRQEGDGPAGEAGRSGVRAVCVRLPPVQGREPVPQRHRGMIGKE